MSTIKIEDIAHVRFQAPDLGEMQTFLEQFGLKPGLSDDGVLYARGTGPAPFLHATQPGEPRFVAIGFRAASTEDLHRLAEAEASTVEPHDAPGGGFVVRLTDPDGYLVEVVAGQDMLPPLALIPGEPHNDARAKARQRAALRLPEGPATVVRLGHAVLEVTDFRASEAWYKARFGFITSDEIEMAPGLSIGAFMRCDRGETPTDHHTLFLLQAPSAPRFNHAAFEVTDMDDLMCGHTHLKRARRTPAWGVGRHVLGSQIFDYWKDPWGHELEHWTDGDLFTAADGSNTATFRDLLNVQWGPLHPMMAGEQA
ncbi:VOC family protein [Hyphomonas sp.]|uniref:VOC family protein n=1 Tax=Hyphomonas sp. TaxID=87 RepID=UPI00391B722E